MVIFLVTFKAQPWIATKSGLPLTTRLFIHGWNCCWHTPHSAWLHVFIFYLEQKKNGKLHSFYLNKDSMKLHSISLFFLFCTIIFNLHTQAFPVLTEFLKRKIKDKNENFIILFGLNNILLIFKTLYNFKVFNKILIHLYVTILYDFLKSHIHGLINVNDHYSLVSKDI